MQLRCRGHERKCTKRIDYLLPEAGKLPGTTNNALQYLFYLYRAPKVTWSTDKFFLCPTAFQDHPKKVYRAVYSLHSIEWPSLAS
jgi:hypothetical protein